MIRRLACVAPLLLHEYEGQQVRFEVFMAVTMKNGVSWDVTRATWRNIPEDMILHEDPHFIENTINSGQEVRKILGLFLELYRRGRDVAMLCNMVLQHTLLIIP
jgi:hypothetical protein